MGTSLEGFAVRDVFEGNGNFFLRELFFQQFVLLVELFIALEERDDNLAEPVFRNDDSVFFLGRHGRVGIPARKVISLKVGLAGLDIGRYPKEAV